jgi:hypothetical protein
MALPQGADAGTASNMEVKTKTILLVQAWTGPEGCRRLRLPDFKTVGLKVVRF